MSLFSLCAAKWVSYTPDIVVAIFFLIMIILSAYKGFIGCLLGIVTSLVAVLLAVFLSGVVVDGTGGLFGLQGVLAGKFASTFAKVDGFNVDVSSVGVEAALKSQDVSAVLSRLVLKIAGKEEEIAAGTTLATLLGKAVGSLAARLIAGVLLFILIKVVVTLLKKMLKSVLDNIPVLGGVNRVLGGVFGLLYAWVIVSAILMVFALIPNSGITLFLTKGWVVRFLYEHNILVIMLGWFL